MEPSSYEEIRRQKQIYLREEIMKPGHDVTAFMQFVESKKEGGSSNIDLFNFEELKEYVREFLANLKNSELREESVVMGRNESDIREENDYQKSEYNETEGNDNENKSEKEGNDMEFQTKPVSNSKKEYKKNIKCKKIDTSDIPDNIKCQVSGFIFPYLSFEIKEGFISALSYVQYNISTTPIGWEVKRRYSDFYWLRATLNKLYPHLYV